MILAGFFKCECGKMHMAFGFHFSAKCPQCDRNLWDMMRKGTIIAQWK